VVICLRKWVTGLRVKRLSEALALDPNLAVAHDQMGDMKQLVDFDWAGADASYQRAIALEPAMPRF